MFESASSSLPAHKFTVTIRDGSCVASTWDTDPSEPPDPPVRHVYADDPFADPMETSSCKPKLGIANQ